MSTNVGRCGEMGSRDSVREQNAHRKGNGKGKGKEPTTFASRLASSASGMARSTFDSTYATHLPATLSSSTLLGHKVASGPTPRTPHWLQDVPVRSGTSLNACGQAESSHSSFRSTPTNEQPDLEFNEFLGSPPNFYPLDLETLNELLISSTSVADSPLLAAQNSLHSLDSPADQASAIHHSQPHFSPVDTGHERDETVTDNIQYSSFENAWSAERSFNAPDELEQQNLNAQLSGVQALPRLQMILDHVSEPEYHSFYYQKGRIYQPSPHDLSQRRFVAEGTASRGLTNLSFEQKANEQLSETTVRYLSKWDHGASPGQKMRHMHNHQPPENHTRGAGRDTEEHPEPTFQCPWVRCHQRFNNPSQLKMETSDKTYYACPHHDCMKYLPSRQVWAEHIMEPHHDLLETGDRS